MNISSDKLCDKKAKRGRPNERNMCRENSRDKENRRHVLTIDKPSLQLDGQWCVVLYYFNFFRLYGVTKNDDSPRYIDRLGGHKYSKNFEYFGACHIVPSFFLLSLLKTVDLLTFFCLFRLLELLFSLFVAAIENVCHLSLLTKSERQTKHIQTHAQHIQPLFLRRTKFKQIFKRFGRFCVQIPFGFWQ